MARRNTRFLGPPAICDACGKPGWDLLQAGNPCAWCDDGVFMHRQWWVYTPCPVCGLDRHSECAACNGAGVLATPREDIDLGELRREWASLSDRYERWNEPVPKVIEERRRWAAL